MRTLMPGAYWMTRWQNQFTRSVVRVQVLCLRNADLDYYTVQLPSGVVTVASGSMLRPA